VSAHACDELSISKITAAPCCADLSRDVFIDAIMALLMVAVWLATGVLTYVVSPASLVFLTLLRAMGAKSGGANVLRATIRVTFWGALALAITAGIGKVFGTIIRRPRPCERLGARAHPRRPD
jgi:vacuolar iron transporter family protein